LQDTSFINDSHWVRYNTAPALTNKRPAHIGLKKGHDKHFTVPILDESISISAGLGPKHCSGRVLMLGSAFGKGHPEPSKTNNIYFKEIIDRKLTLTETALRFTDPVRRLIPLND
jgi:hypothetical protein